MHCVLNPVVSASHHTPLWVCVNKKRGPELLFSRQAKQYCHCKFLSEQNYCYKCANAWLVTVKITDTCHINSVSSQLSQLHEPNNVPILILYSTNNLPHRVICWPVHKFCEFKDPSICKVLHACSRVVKIYEPVSTWGCCISCSVTGTVSVASPGMVAGEKKSIGKKRQLISSTKLQVVISCFVLVAPPQTIRFIITPDTLKATYSYWLCHL